MGVGMVYFHFPFSTHAPVLKRQAHLCFNLKSWHQEPAADYPASKNFLEKELDINPMMSYLREVGTYQKERG